MNLFKLKNLSGSSSERLVEVLEDRELVLIHMDATTMKIKLSLFNDFCKALTEIRKFDFENLRGSKLHECRYDVLRSYPSLFQGASFTCNIKTHKNVQGKLSYQGSSPYLCQDIITGTQCDDKLGYKYSWYYDHSITEFKVQGAHPSTIKKFEKAMLPYKPVIRELESLFKHLIYILKDSVYIGCNKYSIDDILKIYDAINNPFKQEIDDLKNKVKHYEKLIAEISELLQKDSRTKETLTKKPASSVRDAHGRCIKRK